MTDQGSRMTAMDELTVILEEQRTHRRGVANRLVGSVHEARRRLSRCGWQAGAWPRVIIVAEGS
jgi:hypothetical protein